ncbi:MAG: thioredoxin family protein [Bergeyella sp.]
MKSVLLLLYFFIPSLLLAQHNIKFEEATFSEILQKAKKEKKLVFLDAYTSWCGYCKKMEKNIFTLESVSNYYNSNFINAHFDMEKGEGREIAQKYGIRSYPTYLFLNGDGEVVMKNFGYLEEQDFLTVAKEANNPENLRNMPRERFARGESNPEFLLNMMKQYAQSDYELAKKVSERYFSLKKPDEYTPDDVGILLYFVKSPDDFNFKILENNKEIITKYLPENTYEEFKTSLRISKILENSLDRQNKIIKDDEYYQKAIPLVGKTEAEKALNRAKINFYPVVGNFAEYEKAALAYYQNPNEFNPNELLKAAWIFSEYITTPASLKKAQKWVEKGVNSSKNAENTYILAKLYHKTGDIKQAKIYAEMSKSISEQDKADSSLATKLLNELQEKK